MIENLIPDYIYNSVYDIPVDLFTMCGIRGVIFDIDNTLVPYDVVAPTKRLEKWLQSLLDSDIKIAFVSNNSRDRVERFARDLESYCFHKSRKPSPRTIFKAIEIMGLDRRHVAMIGDQIFTDVLAAKRAGIISIMVKPITLKHENLFIKTKRRFEAPFIHAYHKREGTWLPRKLRKKEKIHFYAD